MKKLVTTKGNAWLIVLLIVAIIVVALLLTRQGDDNGVTTDGETTEEVDTSTAETLGNDGAAAVEATEDGSSADGVVEDVPAE